MKHHPSSAFSTLRKIRALPYAGVLALMLTSCDLAPNFQAPHYVVPENWSGQAPFAKAAPQSVSLKQDWWTDFRDPILNDLENRALKENATLQAAGERFVQARAITTKIRAQLLPQLHIDSGAGNYRQSDDRLFRPMAGPTEDSEDYAGMASWEPDFWSSIRNRVRMGRLESQALGAEFAAMRLSMEAEIAQDYIQLRGFDAQMAIYRRSIAYYDRALKITKDQLDNQAAPLLDVERARAQLYATQAALYEIQGARALVEHALATLCNAVPAGFSIAPADKLDLPHPTVPVTLPSGLLERRPDIAAQEKRMEEQNRAIGIARAAFFPHVVFKIDGGFEGGDFNLATLANSLWSYGGRVNIPIFEGGLRRAELQRSWSAYRESRDNYRATVLDAFKEVEDALTLSNRLNLENEALIKTVTADAVTQNMTMTLYQGGVGTYLEAIVSQENTLQARIRQVTVATRQYQAEIKLIRSLGGGWNQKDLPDYKKILSVKPFQYSNLDTTQKLGDVDFSEKDEFNDLTAPKQSHS